MVWCNKMYFVMPEYYILSILTSYCEHTVKTHLCSNVTYSVMFKSSSNRSKPSQTWSVRQSYNSTGIIHKVSLFKVKVLISIQTMHASAAIIEYSSTNSSSLLSVAVVVLLSHRISIFRTQQHCYVLVAQPFLCLSVSDTAIRNHRLQGRRCFDGI